MASRIRHTLLGNVPDRTSERSSVMATDSQPEINEWVSQATAEVCYDLPDGSYSPEVLQHILATEDPDIATCLGPAVPFLRLAAVIDVAATITFFALAYLTNVYDSAWWLKYIILLPVVVHRFYVEWKALRHFIPAYVYDAVRTTDSLWPVLVFNGTFRQWRFVGLFFSVLGSVDNFLDTATAAATMSVMVNDSGETQHVYERISGRFWNSMGMNCPHIVWFVILMWMCTLVLPIAHLVFTIPRGPLNYSIGDSGLQFYLGQRLNFEGVFFFLSASCGMSSILSLEFRQGSHELSRIAPHEMISYVQPMAASMLKRICYSYLLRNSLQLNLQTLIFTINLHNGQVRAQTQTAVSIIVSIIMALKKLTEVVAFEKYIADAKKRWASDEELEKHIDDAPQNHLFRDWKRGFWKLEFAIRLTTGMTACMLIVAGLRLIMAAFVCESHLFEITEGCLA